VVGPTEALRDRGEAPRGPAEAPRDVARALRDRPGGTKADVPPGRVPGPPDPERQSGWQLAQRAWRDSGLDWEAAAPAQPDYEQPDPYAPEPYSTDWYALDTYPDDPEADAQHADPGTDPEYPEADPEYPDFAEHAVAAPEDTSAPEAADAHPVDDLSPAHQYSAQDDYPADDLSPAHQYSAAPHAAVRYLADPHSTRPDLPVLPASADSRHGLGPWPVQQPPEPRRPEPEDQHQHPGQDAPPPLPRRVRQAFAQPSPFAPSSPFAPRPAFAAPRPLDVPRRPLDARRQPLDPPPAPGRPQGHAPAPLGAPVASVAPVAPAAPPLGESDELFRAWQGSVKEAASQRTPWSDRRPPARRGHGRQAARIGVPAAVIVTVGAGALILLTGRANHMLAMSSSNGPLSAGQPGAGAFASGQANGSAAPGPADPAGTGQVLAGYPGGHGSVGVAAMWSAAGTTMAVGSADAHPAVWRHAADGSWSLVSAAALGGLTGHLTSVAQGPSGWIAVGSARENGVAEPVIFTSPDGVTWTGLPALTTLAGSDAQFVGVAAGPGGYLVVGKIGSGSNERAGFWWSGDLKSWVSGSGMGAPSHAGAAVAVKDGFVAVGAMANCHTIWLSPDGQHWTEHDLSKPSGASTATLESVAADQDGRFVAAGSATGSAGDIPLVVTSADDGAHVTQVVLQAPQGPASVTTVTATSDGFVAVGLAGPAHAQRAVEWTSPDGVTWSSATPVASAGANAITAMTGTGTGTTVTGTAEQGTGPSVMAIPAK
jgi:hypothetical protein